MMQMNSYELRYGNLKGKSDIDIDINYSGQKISYHIIDTMKHNNQLILVNMDICYESYPCQHNVIYLEYDNDDDGSDGKNINVPISCRNGILFGNTLYNYGAIDSHFSGYEKYE